MDVPRAVSLLGTMGGQLRAVELLIVRMADKNPLLRREAACALSDRAVKLHRPGGRGGEDAHARHRRGRALVVGPGAGHVGTFPAQGRGSAAPALRLQADEKETPPARLILEVQGPGSSRAVAALVELLKERSSRVQYEAGAGAGPAGPGRHWREPALLDRPPERRQARPSGRGRRPGHGWGAEVLPGGAEAAEQPRRPGVREGAAHPGADGRAGPLGCQAAHRRTQGRRVAACRHRPPWRLWNVDRDASLALRTLNLVLKDVDNKDRWEAVDAVGLISMGAGPTIPGLTEVLLNSGSRTATAAWARAAKWLFRRTKQAVKVVPLLPRRRDGPRRLRPTVHRRDAGRDGRRGEGRAAFVYGPAQTATSTYRPLAAEGLAHGGADVVPQLVEALKNKDARVKAGVARALGLIGPAARGGRQGAAVAAQGQGSERPHSISRTCRGGFYGFDSGEGKERFCDHDGEP